MVVDSVELVGLRLVEGIGDEEMQQKLGEAGIYVSGGSPQLGQACYPGTA